MLPQSRQPLGGLPLGEDPLRIGSPKVGSIGVGSNRAGRIWVGSSRAVNLRVSSPRVSNPRAGTVSTVMNRIKSSSALKD